LQVETTGYTLRGVLQGKKALLKICGVDRETGARGGQGRTSLLSLLLLKEQSRNLLTQRIQLINRHGETTTLLRSSIRIGSICRSGAICRKNTSTTDDREATCNITDGVQHSGESVAETIKQTFSRRSTVAVNRSSRRLFLTSGIDWR
jgi:hypothetical protein